MSKQLLLEPQSARSFNDQVPEMLSVSDGEAVDARFRAAQSDDESQHFRRRHPANNTRPANLKTLRQHHMGWWRGDKKPKPSSKKHRGTKHNRGDPQQVVRTAARLPIACKCTADSYDLQHLYSYYSTHGMNPTIFDDVVHIEFGLLSNNKSKLAHDTEDNECSTVGSAVVGDKTFDAFFFPYGVFVCWGVSETEIAALEAELQEFEEKQLDEEDIYGEEFDFRYDTRGIYINRLKDEIILDQNFNRSDDIDTKFAISHGLALSVKLSVFEGEIAKTIEDTKHLPEELALDGSIHMTDQEISKIIGEIFIQRNSVNLHLDVLDLSLIHISEPTRLLSISYAVFCLKKKKKKGKKVVNKDNII
eukprot:TRINITY_DN4978_c0_g1_i5.p1 TRINITY_DN4978_c0_g1~~TRINITY_DN4978_c0_g1_i5.p1  ORF type:complete len:362 (+),score=89.16 TRINITY_DN4978_c0_g1_i5:188-1273(+)